MKVFRTTDRKAISDAYGVHVKDAYELVKMHKKPVHHDLGELKINDRIIFYSTKSESFCGVNYRYNEIELDISQLQPLMDQLVNSEKPYDKERFENFQLDMTPENYKNWFIRNDGKCKDLVYLDDSLRNIIGFARMHELVDNGKKFLYIYNFVVDNKYRGKGIGKYMLKRLENCAFNTKCDEIILSCYRVNKAIKLYKSLGFKEIH